MEAKASVTAGDFAVLVDTNGSRWGFAFDTTGSDAEPTSTVWTAIPSEKKVQVDISGDTTAANVAASVELAVDALVGFSAVFTSDDTAADGTIYFESVVAGALADPEDYAAASTTDGSSGMTWAETTAGADKVEPSSSVWAGLDYTAEADLTSATTAV